MSDKKDLEKVVGGVLESVAKDDAISSKVGLPFFKGLIKYRDKAGANQMLGLVSGIKDLELVKKDLEDVAGILKKKGYEIDGLEMADLDLEDIVAGKVDLPYTLKELKAYARLHDAKDDLVKQVRTYRDYEDILKMISTIKDPVNKDVIKDYLLSSDDGLTEDDVASIYELIGKKYTK